MTPEERLARLEAEIRHMADDIKDLKREIHYLTSWRGTWKLAALLTAAIASSLLAWIKPTL